MAWFAAAVAERRRGRVAAARGALEIALEVAPGAVSVHLELADVLLELEDPGRAATHAQAAVRLEGSSPRALAMLARALRGVGRKAEAIEAAQAALAIQPDDPETRALLSRVSLEDREPGWVERTKRALVSWTKR